MAEGSPEAAESAQAAAQPNQSSSKKTYKQISLPSPEEQLQEDSMNNCAVRTVISGGMGMVLGVVFGIFMGTMDGAGVGMEVAGAQKQTAVQVAKEMFITARSRSWTYAKAFGAMGALFAGSECVVEKARAKHDIYNSVYAGCFTGGSIAYGTGPKGMCAGCVTFAAFSALIDKIMEKD